MSDEILQAYLSEIADESTGVQHLPKIWTCACRAHMLLRLNASEIRQVQEAIEAKQKPALPVEAKPKQRSLF